MQSTKTKSPAKKSQSKGITRTDIAAAAGGTIKTLQIEDNIAMPSRGHDPHFESKVTEVLTAIKPGQSFVVAKGKVHSVNKIADAKFEDYKLRRHLIIPDGKFTRIWRIS